MGAGRGAAIGRSARERRVAILVRAIRAWGASLKYEHALRRNPCAPSAVALLCAAGSLASAAPALACSICRCGDPTFNALGLTGVSLEGMRLALDWDSVEKSQGSAANEDLESAKEQRMTLLLGYSFSPDWSVYVRLPRSERDLTEAEDGDVASTHTTGFADPELYAQRRLWSSPFTGDVGVRAALFAVAGVKTAWGDNDLSRDGERLDEHAQPGTGSTDWFGGLSGLVSAHAALGAVRVRAVPRDRRQRRRL